MHRASNILPFHLFLVRESLSPGATPAPYLRHIFKGVLWAFPESRTSQIGLVSSEMQAFAPPTLPDLVLLPDRLSCSKPDIMVLGLISATYGDLGGDG